MSWICDKNGVVKCEAKRLSYNGVFMDVSSITVTIESPSPIDFAIGDYIDWDYDGMRYTLDASAAVEKQARMNSIGNAFIYENLVFLSPLSAAEHADFLDVVIGNQLDFHTNTEFSFFGTAWDYAKRLEANLCRLYGAGSWKVRIWTNGVCYDSAPATLDTGAWEGKLVDVSRIKCLAGFQQIYDLWGCAYVFSVVEGVNYVDFYDDFELYAKAWEQEGVAKIFAYGKGNGLYKIRHSQDDDHVLVTRLRAYGSGENIPANYYLNSPRYHVDGNESSELAIANLMLPASAWTKGGVKHPSNAYIEQNVDLYGVREASVYWDGSDSELGEIKPTIYKLTIQDLLNYMSSGEPYRPVESKWPDTSQRIDEIITGAQPTDNGVVKEAGYDFTVVYLSLSFLSRDLGDMLVDKEVKFGDLVMSALFPMISDLAEYRLVPQGDDHRVVSFVVPGANASSIRSVSAYITPYIGTRMVENATIPMKVVPRAVTVDNETTMHYEIFLEDSSENFIVFSASRTGALRFSIRALIDYTTEDHETFEVHRYEHALNFNVVRGGKVIDKFFSVIVPQVGFDLAAAVSSGAMMCMRSGYNQPREFPIVPSSVRYNADSDTWYVRCKRVPDDSIGTYFPNNDAPIEAGDEYYFTGIAMPALFVEIAAQRLLSAASAWLALHSKPRMLSSVDVDNKIMAEEGIVLKEGMSLPLDDTDLGITPGTQESRVIENIRIEEGESSIRTFSITLRDKKERSSLDAAIRGATSGLATTSSVNAVAQSVQQQEHGSLSGRDMPDQHPISSITGLEEALLSNSFFELDDDGNVKLKDQYNGLWAQGFISAGGVGSSGGGGGGGASILEVWRSLTNNPQLVDSDITSTLKIAAAHIPIGSGLSVNSQGLIDVTVTGTVTSVAGVSPVGGDVPVANLKTALGIGNLDNDLTRISDCLISLQSQIDSVSSRDAFDELTVTALFADTLAASAIHASEIFLDGKKLDWFIPEEYESGKYRLRLNPKYYGMYADGWIAAGGVGSSTGGGGGDIDLDRVWESLTNNIDFPNVKINTAHIPDTASIYGYLKGNQTITLTGVVTGSGTTSIATSIADGALSIAKVAGLQDDLNTVSTLLLSLQSQVDSIATRDMFDELTATELFSDVAAFSSLYADALYIGSSDINSVFASKFTFAANALNLVARDNATVLSTVTGANIVTILDSNAVNNVKTEVDNTDTLYIVGVTASATTSLKRDTLITVAGGAMSLASLSATGQVSAGSFKLASGSPVLSWDSDKGAWHLTGNFYADGFITAGGVGSSSGGGDIDLDRVWESLTNNTDFPDTEINPAHIPSLPWSIITSGKPTTLSGYGITNAYTKTEVDNLIGAIDQFHYEIYPSLSDITTPAGNVLYLIGPTGSGSDKYEEYVYANGAFTKIGDTTIDLSAYLTIASAQATYQPIISNLSTIETQAGHGETAYNSLDTISDCLQSLQSQIDSVASRNGFDELTATVLFADMISTPSIYVETLSLNGDDLAGALSNLSSRATSLEGRASSLESRATSLESRATSLEGKFTGDSANSALRLAGTSAYSIWGVEYWANGVPKSVTGRPGLFIGSTQVQTSSATQDLAGIGSITATGALTLSSTKKIYFGDSTHYIELDNDGYFHFSHGLYSEGFVTAGGHGTGGGGGDVDLDRVWESLTNNIDFPDTEINPAHIPDMATIYGYLKGNQTITLTGVVTGIGATSIATSIANGALTIAMVNGLQAALDSKTSNVGTVTSVGLSMPTGFSVSSSPITASGTFSVSFASGYSLLTSTQASTWNGKQDAISDLATIRSNASNGNTAYGWGNHALAGYLTSADGTTISECLQSLQSQIDSVASRSVYDELAVAVLGADMLTASGAYIETISATSATISSISGSLSGNATTASYLVSSSYGIGGGLNPIYFSGGRPMASSSTAGSASVPVFMDGGTLTAITPSSLFSTLSSSAGTNLSVTIAGQNRTATLYATYDSASENISDKFGIVSDCLRSLQSQVDSVSSRDSFDELNATVLYADVLSVGSDFGIGGNVTIGGTLGVTGATNLYSTLRVSGATTLSSTLEVTGNTTISGRLGVGGSASSPLMFYVNGSAGIQNALTVTGATTLSGATAVNNTLTVGTSTTNRATTLNGTLYVSDNTTVMGRLGVGAAASSPLMFYVSGKSGLDGDTSIGGALTVGTASANKSTTLNGTLAVTGATTLTGALTVNNTATISGNASIGGNATIGGNIYMTAGNSIDLDGGLDIIYYDSSNTTVYFNFDYDSHFSSGIYSDTFITAGGVNASSDARLKDNLSAVSAEKALSVLMQLRPMEWVWNEKHYMNGQKGAGLVAQEVESVLPFAVSHDTEYLSINYNVFHAYEIAGLQNHEERIKALEKENDELRRKLERINP